MNSRKIALTVLFSCFLGSCATQRIYKESKEIGASSGSLGGGVVSLDAGDIDTSIHGGIGSGATAAMLGVKKVEASSTEELMKMHQSEDQIFFTNIDDPTNQSEELKAIFDGAAKKKSGWLTNYDEALAEARRSGKPILIWFHDSQFGRSSNALGKEVLKDVNFEAWAKDNIIRVRFDKSEVFQPQTKPGDNLVQKNDARKEASLKKKAVMDSFSKFGVRGTPVVLIICPDGQRMAELSGYKSGGMNDMNMQIKHNVTLAAKKEQEQRDRLRKEGYRTWTGKNRIEIFAKLIKFDPKSGYVWFKQFYGTTSKVKLDKLSSEDQAFLKKQYGNA